MPAIFQPANPVAWPPANRGRGPYTAKPGESFETIAKREGIDPWTLITFNFKTTRPDEVNWYLANVLKCTRLTADGKNYRFSGGETIYLPLISSADGGGGSWTGVFERTWDEREVALYQEWVRTNAAGPGYVGRSDYRRDCADFAISVLIDYAARRRLPVAFRNGPSQRWRGWNNTPEGMVRLDPQKDGEINVAGLTLNHYSATDAAYVALAALARQRVLAHHLYDPGLGDTVGIAFGQLAPGDLLVRPGSSHVQVVLKPRSDITANVVEYLSTGPAKAATPRRVLEIVQGNLPDSSTATRIEQWQQAVPIKHKAWDLNPGQGPHGSVYRYYVDEKGQWEEATPDTDLRTFEARRWNFSAFNHAYGLTP